MEQFDAQRLIEALYRVFSPAICALKRNTAVRESRTYINDGSPTALSHARQYRHNRIDVSKVGHLGNSFKFFRRDIGKVCKNGGECDINPYIDFPKVGFDILDRALNFLWFRDISLHCKNFGPESFNVGSRRFQSGFATSD